ncbi:phosphoribosylanthranilate isomerase [Daejeonella rubra]|uniref:N-(5'-phosphoribosyl)anthranilate isomerase n=1 Tax=Daejeonella rubra TaxID=990371 RepID=A0A1G9LZL5_9SPHI|nr:phosphoribosylanthranilate isomerase [Daejeonella rubra]SDL67396.1 phosphoribosylanthranilate isomerase [Daejeonella rubra]
MKIKVCGMRDPDNIVDLAQLKPDYMGLIFYPQSKRFAGNPDKSVLSSLPDSIKLTGVFVNEKIEEIIQKVDEYDLNAVQLHGSESDLFCKQLRDMLNLRMPIKKIEIIKAFGIFPGFDFNELKPFNDVVDYFLFDTKTAAHGGSGIMFDWKILDQYKGQKPYFLSGGLSPENIPEISNLGLEYLYGIDLNSKFELEPGLKDINSLKSAFELVRI